MFDLETQIRSWSNRLRGRGNFLDSDIEELEGHLRDEIESLKQSGLADDEAFLVAVKRMGGSAALSQEYAKVNTEHLWKQLMLEPEDPAQKAQSRKELWIVAALTLLAGTLGKVPALFGVHLFGGDEVTYFKNLSLFVFPVVTGYFFWKRGITDVLAFPLLAIPFIISAILINIYPSYEPYHTPVLTGIHLPIMLWLFVGLAYMSNRWSDLQRRMDFVRFSGEAFIYSVLICCGGVVLIGITMIIFAAIDVNVGFFVRRYLMVYGGLGTLVVAAYLVEAKKSIVENLAPVLAKIFSPLFLLTMLSFLGVTIILGKSPYSEREFLIGFDLLLVLVLGLVLYVISARNRDEAPGVFDTVNFALIVTALIVDVVALWAVIGRLSTFGFSANKVAALGENIVLLVNLSGLAVFYIRFFTKKAGFQPLETWQTRYLPVYSGWAAVVALLFPVIFGFK